MITDAKQLQALADLVANIEPEISRDQLNPYYQDWYDHINALEPGQRLAEINFARHEAEDDNDRAFLEQLTTTRPGQRPQYENLEQIGANLPEISWLWPRWIPNQMMTMLAGSPGAGKTYVALDLCYRLMNGLAAPDGQAFETEKRTVVYVDGEDFLSAIYQRAKAWQMNSQHFYPLQRPERGMIDLAKREYQDGLIDMVYDLQPAVIVVDSLSTITTKGENAIEDLRDVLTFLVELSKENKTALILLHHVKKPSMRAMDKPLSMYDLRGSGHIVAMARSVIGIDQNHYDPNGPRTLKVLKTNLGLKPKGLKVAFQPSKENSDIADLVYGSSSSKDDRMAKNRVEECATWLVKQLKEPRSYSDLKILAEKELGVTETTVQRARKHLNGLIIDTHGPRTKGNKWALFKAE